MKTDQPINEGLTAEEILKDKCPEINIVDYFNNDCRNYDSVIEAMEEYASSKLKEKDEEINRLKCSVKQLNVLVGMYEMTMNEINSKK